MPNRILRDWTDSDKINTLSVHAERFFTRLIMKVDDFGCFFSDTRLLKANLFPLLLDSIREADLSRWMAECQKSGLIILYESNGKKYLQILDFKQRLDRKSSKYPLPNDNQVVSIDNQILLEVETKQKQEKETEVEEIPPEFDFLNYCSNELQERYESLEFSLKQKYKAWKEANWHDGNGKKIKNWKSKILNTIPYLKERNVPAQKESKVQEILKVNEDVKRIIREKYSNK